MPTTMSSLYIVATPIGNLDDLTVRAANVFKTVPVVIAEDTRVTRRILNHVDAQPRIVSLHRHSSKGDISRAVNHLDEGDVALVSDAGTPGVNDPGQAIVEAAVERGHQVVPLPGPSSVIAALSVSGFYADKFVSYGFLPSAGNKRRRLLNQIAVDATTGVVFETPHRLRDALVDMAASFGDRPLAICREMTKLHEEIWRGTANEALEHFVSPRGEFVIVVAPLQKGGDRANSEASLNYEKLIHSAASELEDHGLSRRDLVDAVVDKTGLPRRQVYQSLHQRPGSES